MEQNILKEELGISNDVNKIVSQLKSFIGDNYNKNKDSIKKYVKLPNFQNSVFKNDFNIKINGINIEIHVIYYVLLNPSLNIKNEYLRKFSSTSESVKYELELYLTAYYDKIDWNEHAATIQHEVEHLYQLFKKEKPLLTDKQLKSYNKMKMLRKSNDFLTSIIGFTYYFYNRHEKDAFINGVYREIIDSYISGMNFNTIDLIKKTQIYQDIQLIKDIINNKNNWSDLCNRLEQNNITFKSYMRVANTMISEYTKSFGRLLYKLNKDIGELNKTKLDTPYFGIDNNN